MLVVKSKGVVIWSPRVYSSSSAGSVDQGEERAPRPSIKVVAVDPLGSVFHHWFHNGELVPSSPYEVEGLGDEFIIDSGKGMPEGFCQGAFMD